MGWCLLYGIAGQIFFIFINPIYFKFYLVFGLRPSLDKKITKQLSSIFIEGQRISTLVKSPRKDTEAILK